ncbi:cell wall-binding repeat-containing protein [Peptostreptococcus faecalis]|uniref:cell wall-binding repeat-containing protein n=1 Tax=Peptostreptococcus faecalis TaxID=2045015 RepID=UPI000C7C83BA|nr:cell wall-binding repeat-containing protein [Peptostreptococcus faecalis]
MKKIYILLLIISLLLNSIVNINAIYSIEDSQSQKINQGEDLKTYTIKVKYILKNGDEIAQPYLATVHKGYKLVENIKSPYIEGYIPDKDTINLNISSVDKDKEYTVKYSPSNEGKYKINYRLPSLEDPSKYKTETIELSGPVGSNIVAPIKEFKGFSPPKEIPTTVINVDGSTEIDVYYSRNLYTLYFDTEGGSYIEPITGFYEQNLIPPSDIPEKKGYEFKKWDKVIPSTMPAENTVFKAMWEENNKSNYSVEYRLENSNREGYQLKRITTQRGIVGEMPYIPKSYPWESLGNMNNLYYLLQDYVELNKEKTENEKEVIKSDGSTSLKVYWDFKKYNLHFKNLNDKGYYYYKNGEKIIGDYIIYDVKLFQDMTDSWPEIRYEGEGSSSVIVGYRNKTGGKSAVISPLNMNGQIISAFQLGYKSSKDINMEIFFDDRVIEPTVINHMQNIGGKEYISKQSKAMVITNNLLKPKDIKGFTVDISKDDGNGVRVTNKDQIVNFWYNRNKNELIFRSDNDDVKKENLWYEESLDNYLNFIPNTTPIGKKNYQFKGWYSSKELLPETKVEPGNEEKMDDKILKLYAKWEAPNCIVRFKPNNGEKNFSIEAKYLEKIVEPTIPKRENYIFKGWRQVDKKYNFNFNIMPIIDSITLEAVWEPIQENTLLIRYLNRNNNEKLSEDLEIKDLKEGIVQLLDAKVIDSYFPDKPTKNIRIKKGKNEIIFYYVPLTTSEYKVKYLDVNGKDLLPEVNKKTTKAIDTENYIHIEGYTPQKKQITFKLIDEKEVKFIYNKENIISDNISVTYKGNGETSGVVPVDSNKYIKGNEVTILGKNTLKKDGYKFIGWNLKFDGSGIKYDVNSKFNIVENTILYAMWEKDSTPGGGGGGGTTPPTKRATAVLANGKKYTDVLTATVLANERDCPILLTDKNDITTETFNELKRRGIGDVIISGGPDSVSQKVVDQLKDFNVIRYAGSDRYGTAREIGKEVRALTGKTDGAMLVDGTNFPDVITISALATQKRVPILITNPNKLNSTTENVIKDWKLNNIVIGGSTNSVAKTIQDRLNTDLKISSVSRIGGVDRYETASLIGKEVRALTGKKTDMILVDGTDFPDGITINSLAAKFKCPIHLTKPNYLTDITAKDIADWNIDSILVGGGENSVSKSIYDGLKVTNKERISGEDRYSTAVKISQRLDKILISIGK